MPVVDDNTFWPGSVPDARRMSFPVPSRFLFLQKGISQALRMNELAHGGSVIKLERSPSEAVGIKQVGIMIKVKD